MCLLCRASLFCSISLIFSISLSIGVSPPFFSWGAEVYQQALQPQHLPDHLHLPGQQPALVPCSARKKKLIRADRVVEVLYTYF